MPRMRLICVHLTRTAPPISSYFGCYRPTIPSHDVHFGDFEVIAILLSFTIHDWDHQLVKKRGLCFNVPHAKCFRQHYMDCLGFKAGGL